MRISDWSSDVCSSDLIRTRLVAATDRLAQLYPAAKFPPITIAIGRATTAGTANAKGLYIGLEALCAAKFIEADDEDRFVHVIAHEYVNVQQPLAQVEDREERSEERRVGKESVSTCRSR